MTQAATRQELESAVSTARTALKAAKRALSDWEELAENNVYDDLDTAESDVEDRLSKRASKDCQGAYNCGAEQYTQDFIVAGKRYRGTLTCEYNRHDKTYYYVDSEEFTCECLTPGSSPS